MTSALLLLSLLLLGAFLGGLLLASTTKWRIWAVAIATSLIATVILALIDPIHIDLGSALVTFLPALAGAFLGSKIRLKRTA